MTSIEKALKRGFASLYKEEALTDFTITCGTYTAKVHTAILAAQSAYFKRTLLDPSNDISNSIELPARGPSDEVHISLDEVDAVKAMVHFCYHFDYTITNVSDKMPTSPRSDSPNPRQPDKKRARTSEPKITLDADERRARTSSPVFGSSTPLSNAQNAVKQAQKSDLKGDGNMVMHAKVFACAIRYEIPALRTLAAQKFAAAVTLNADHATFAEAMKVVYATTPDTVQDLRDIILNTLDNRDELLDRADVDKVVQGINLIAYEVMCRCRKRNKNRSFASFGQSG